MKVSITPPNISTVSAEANMSVVNSDMPAVVVSEVPQTSLYSSVVKGDGTQDAVSYWLWGDSEVVLWSDEDEIEI